MLTKRIIALLSLVFFCSSHAVNVKPYIKPTLKLTSGALAAYVSFKDFKLCRAALEIYNAQKDKISELLVEVKEQKNPVDAQFFRTAIINQTSQAILTNCIRTSSARAALAYGILSSIALYSGIKDLQTLRQ